MEIAAISGTILTELSEEDVRCMVEDGRTVRDLKKILTDPLGHSRFRQRLFSEGLGELQDHMPLAPSQSEICSFGSG